MPTWKVVHMKIWEDQMLNTHPQHTAVGDRVQAIVERNAFNPTLFSFFFSEILLKNLH